MDTYKPNITFVLCEGKHDSAILTRLLRLNGFSECKDKKIKEFPILLKGFFEAKFNKFVYEDENNIHQKPQLPNHICKSKTEDKWFVFYEMGSDSKSLEALKIIEPLKVITSEFSNSESFETQEMVSVVLFFDADININKRKEQFIKDCNESLPTFCQKIQSLSGNEFELANIDGYAQIGLYIYSTVSGSGTLEDILLPVIKNGNEDIFQDADVYLEKHMTVDAKKSGSKKGKALIGVIGQPKHQGRANQSIIADTKYITKEKLDADEVFSGILSFLKKF